MIRFLTNATLPVEGYEYGGCWYCDIGQKLSDVRPGRLLMIDHENADDDIHGATTDDRRRAAHAHVAALSRLVSDRLDAEHFFYSLPWMGYPTEAPEMVRLLAPMFADTHVRHIGINCYVYGESEETALKRAYRARMFCDGLKAHRDLSGRRLGVVPILCEVSNTDIPALCGSVPEFARRSARMALTVNPCPDHVYVWSSLQYHAGLACADLPKGHGGAPAQQESRDYLRSVLKLPVTQVWNNRRLGPRVNRAITGNLTSMRLEFLEIMGLPTV